MSYNKEKILWEVSEDILNILQAKEYLTIKLCFTYLVLDKKITRATIMLKETEKYGSHQM